ncbi:IclR family transcriptional regulator [Aurantimonas sp. VKM B-3413]|uniref:IclR family transcriptional regulator n=1 Tax=Aurantimonas sp. VKM B-3413 TaxID=2779401 RepID=UPI001E54979E|nr:IclR family transcriptional regulator [Aurantimonas sp. VKM B-3413]MCB8837913.1 IclR family transcriptional regulator [Aurantimonas sp. VKM B-3413]
MATQINGSILRAFDILKLFDGGRTELSAAVVTKALGINGVTAHRLLRSLEEAGALVASTRGVYRLGYTLVDLGTRAQNDSHLARVMQPTLDALTRHFDEASMAMVFEANALTCIAKAVSSRPLYVDIRVGSRLEAYCTAHGKVWLAEISADRLERYLSDIERRAFSARTLVERTDILADLAGVRAVGYALNVGEREADVNAVAVPVKTRSGTIVSSISLFGPSSRLTRETLLAAVPQLQAAAAALERELYGDVVKATRREAAGSHDASTTRR